MNETLCSYVGLQCLCLKRVISPPACASSQLFWGCFSVGIQSRTSELHPWDKSSGSINSQRISWWFHSSGSVWWARPRCWNHPIDECVILAQLPTWKPCRFSLLSKSWGWCWDEVWDVQKELSVPTLSQLGFWQSIPALLDTVTSLPVIYSLFYKHFLTLWGLICSPSSTAQQSHSAAEPNLPLFTALPEIFAGKKNFLLFQCFIFKSTLSMVYLCKATFGYKVLHRVQVGIAAFLKINWGSCEPVQKNLKIPNITGPLHLVVLFSIIFWAWIFLNFFSHISFYNRA